MINDASVKVQDNPLDGLVEEDDESGDLPALEEKEEEPDIPTEHQDADVPGENPAQIPVSRKGAGRVMLPPI